MDSNGHSSIILPVDQVTPKPASSDANARINSRWRGANEKVQRSLFWTITKTWRLKAPIGRCFSDRVDITVFQDHLVNPEAVIARLLPFDVVCVMSERTPMPRNVIERLPNLKFIASTGAGNASIDVGAAGDDGTIA
jgi:lactate dehydrogenase-like 2-hydroxyacid dehydrogenase